jgi:D-arabinose 5-phosphate isomerase GutQ
VHHPAERRSTNTVLQEMMFKAVRMLHNDGRWVLVVGAGDSGFVVFNRHYGQLETA